MCLEKVLRAVTSQQSNKWWLSVWKLKIFTFSQQIGMFSNGLLVTAYTFSYIQISINYKACFSLFSPYFLMQTEFFFMIFFILTYNSIYKFFGNCMTVCRICTPPLSIWSAKSWFSSVFLLWKFQCFSSQIFYAQFLFQWLFLFLIWFLYLFLYSFWYLFLLKHTSIKTKVIITFYKNFIWFKLFSNEI